MRYHFNVTDGHFHANDTEGVDYASEDEAKAEALTGARHLMAQSDGKGLCRRHWLMVVSDPQGREIFSVPFGHALLPDRLTSDSAGDMGRHAR